MQILMNYFKNDFQEWNNADDINVDKDYSSMSSSSFLDKAHVIEIDYILLMRQTQPSSCTKRSHPEMI